MPTGDAMLLAARPETSAAAKSGLSAREDTRAEAVDR